jgi:hypothetical protein
MYALHQLSFLSPPSFARGLFFLSSPIQTRGQLGKAVLVILKLNVITLESAGRWTVRIEIRRAVRA